MSGPFGAATPSSRCTPSTLDSKIKTLRVEKHRFKSLSMERAAQGSSRRRVPSIRARHRVDGPSCRAPVTHDLKSPIPRLRATCVRCPAMDASLEGLVEARQHRRGDRAAKVVPDSVQWLGPPGSRFVIGRPRRRIAAHWRRGWRTTCSRRFAIPIAVCVSRRRRRSSRPGFAVSSHRRSVYRSHVHRSVSA